MIRWLKFNAVGIMGAGVQLAALALFVKVGVEYLLATVLAVETALLHNFVWHRHWTWPERRGSRLESLWRFQCSNGLVSIVSNVILMRVLAGWAGLPTVPANVLAICSTSLLNFWLSERWVFVTSGRS
jgi:putative flippase GtrA